MSFYPWIIRVGDTTSFIVSMFSKRSRTKIEGNEPKSDLTAFLSDVNGEISTNAGIYIP